MIGEYEVWDATGCDARLPNFMERFAINILRNHGWIDVLGPKGRLNSLVIPMDYSDAKKVKSSYGDWKCL